MSEHDKRSSSHDDLEPDVERIHRPLYREPSDPLEGRERAPWWLWTVAALALFWSGWYLGEHGGTFGAQPHIAFSARPSAAVAPGGPAETSADPLAVGRDLYTQRCQPCHQPDGEGLAGVFPPVRGSEWVTGAEDRVVKIVMHGLQGEITVARQPYNGLMPAWKDQLSDAEIAAVVTYIRQWEPNQASPVSTEEVVEIRQSHEARATPWTAEELTGGGG